MTPTDIAEIFEEHEDQAFWLTLSSGDEIEVPHAGAVRIVGSKIMIFPSLPRGGVYIEGGVRYISAVNVAMITPRQPRPSPGTN